MRETAASVKGMEIKLLNVENTLKEELEKMESLDRIV
jgi:hypothetical protein